MVTLQVKKRHPIGKGDAARLLAQLTEQIGDAAHLFSSPRIEIVETSADLVLYLINKKPLIMKYRGIIFPTLHGALTHPFPARRMTVDTGAVKFVVNGADIMRPGVVSVTDDIIPDGPVQITEERHGKPIAIGISLYPAEEIRVRTEGKVCRNIHHVGDEIWSLEI
jgi:PUA domain protein